MAHDFDLYSLLPLVISTKSLLASGLVDESDATPSILKKIVYALEQEADTTADEIEALRALVDVDTVSTDYLPRLAQLVSSPYLDTWSEDKRRRVVRGIEFVWLTKGLRRSWEAILNLHDYGDEVIYELFKSEHYEVDDYSTFQDVGHPYRAARVGFSAALDPASPDLYPPGLYQIMEVLECVRPIHVLPVSNIISLEALSSDLGLPTDTMASELMPVFSDEPTALTDSVIVVTHCVTWCEAQCESAACELSSCEWGCETTCEDLCETSCVTGCTTACETTCQMTCQLGPCETITEHEVELHNDCNTTCQISLQFFSRIGCEFSCEVSCEIVCETLCQATCEAICQVACQSTCQANCQLACEMGCETCGCQTVCQGACTVACEHGCQNTCQLVCQYECQSICQVACEGSCQASICQTACQQLCELSCQYTCQGACEGVGCETACETGEVETGV